MMSEEKPSLKNRQRRTIPASQQRLPEPEPESGLPWRAFLAISAILNVILIGVVVVQGQPSRLPVVKMEPYFSPEEFFAFENSKAKLERERNEFAAYEKTTRESIGNDLAANTEKEQAIEARRTELANLSDELNSTDVGTLRVKHEKAEAAAEVIARELRTVRNELEALEAKQTLLQAQKQETQFPYENVSFRSQFGTTEMIGEITNNGDETYKIATFTVSVYDDSGNLIDTGNIVMSSFSQGATKSFQCNLLKVEPSQISKYKIEFENGL